MSADQNMWSRRRAAVLAEAEADDQAMVAAAEAQERADLEEKSDAEILAALDLKDPDDLVAGDDFAAFMQAAVPERLRKRALRKLWLSDPVLANVDGLVDYGEDFTDAATVVENLKTAYQVGRGFLKNIEETEAPEDLPAGHADAETLDEVAPEGVAQAGEESDAPATGPAEADEQVADAVLPESAVLPENDDADEIPVKRKMRFEFAS